MAGRQQIFRRDESVPLPNMMDQEIASAINRAMFYNTAPARIRITNPKRYAKRDITAITPQNTLEAMALAYHDDLIKAARIVDKGVIDVEQNESW